MDSFPFNVTKYLPLPFKGGEVYCSPGTKVLVLVSWLQGLNLVMGEPGIGKLLTLDTQEAEDTGRWGLRNRSVTKVVSLTRPP